MIQNSQIKEKGAPTLKAIVTCLLFAILIEIVVTACASLDAMGFLSGDQLIVSSKPDGATVFIDGEESDKTPVRLQVKPGEHLITLSLEHYVPWEDVVSIREGEIQEIEPTLTFVPYRVRLSESLGKKPIWSSDGSKVYFIRSTAEGDRIIQIEVDQPVVEEELFSLDGHLLTEAGWSLDGKQLLGISSADDSEELFTFDLSSKERTQVYQDSEQEGFLTLGNFGIIATWGTGKEVYFVLYRKNPDWNRGNPDALTQEIWRYSGGQTELEKLHEFPSPVLNGLAGAPDRGLLLEKYDDLLRLTPSDTEPISLVNSGIIKTSEWIPNASHIAYLWVEQESDSENILSAMDVIGYHTQELVKGNLTNFHWMPEGKRLVYFTYSTLENGSSCWTVDIETGERTLLADPSIVGQHVFDYAISLDGTRIAFEGEDGHIWLLILDDTKESQGILSRLTEWWNH